MSRDRLKELRAKAKQSDQRSASALQNEDHEMSHLSNNSRYAPEDLRPDSSQLEHRGGEPPATQQIRPDGERQEGEYVDEFQTQVNELVDSLKTLSDKFEGAYNKGENEGRDMELAQLEAQFTLVRDKARNMPTPKSLQQASQMRYITQLLQKFTNRHQEALMQIRTKFKGDYERQYKIAHPFADSNEIKSQLENIQGGSKSPQVFRDELAYANRHGEANRAYQNAEDRLHETQRIEHMLVELSQLFDQMAILVDQQEEQIRQIEQNTDGVKKDIEAGLDHTDKAVISARAARRKRKIIFGLCVLLLVIIAVIIVVVVLVNKKK